MKNGILRLLLSVGIGVATATVFAQPASLAIVTTDNLSAVDPYIGTGGNGHVMMAAQVPFGMVQLGPTVATRDDDRTSGYHYADTLITGFSHLHLSGTGCGDLGDISIVPAVTPTFRNLRFHHAGETVRPGYYAVRTEDPEVLAELTATDHAGMHRYTFAHHSGDIYIGVDLLDGIADSTTAFELVQESPCVVSGYRRSHGWASDQTVFFSIDFSEPVRRVASEESGRAMFAVPATGRPLLLRVGVSPVSTLNAKVNMMTEMPHWDFDRVVAQATVRWKKALERIRIETTDPTLRTLFYTSMYRLMYAPVVYSDVNNMYRGADGKVHREHFTNYTIFSLWDTYRAFHPLMTLIAPERQADYARTMIRVAEQQGKLPIWHLMGNETNCMVGSPAVPVLADLVLKGFVRDTVAAYRAMRQSLQLDERSLGLVKEYGYIPFDKEPTGETVSKALEYALAFSGVAKVARALDKTAEADYFDHRSLLYRKYFDPATGFMRARGSDGRFREPFDPYRGQQPVDDYTEGNAWQYTWLVPHDVHGLIALFGGENAFVGKLDSLFTVTGDRSLADSLLIGGLIGQYAHGNEPSHHIPYLYNYAGQPWKGARLIRQILSRLYRIAPDGLCGNEDVGQMSAWYVLSAIGLYQVDPSGGRFVIGSPAVDKAVLQVGRNRTFTIVTIGNSPQNIYVQSARLNGMPYSKSYIDFPDIVAGGTLELVMGPSPSRWGRARKDCP